jgi:hypothetical protein
VFDFTGSPIHPPLGALNQWEAAVTHFYMHMWTFVVGLMLGAWLHGGMVDSVSGPNTTQVSAWAFYTSQKSRAPNILIYIYSLCLNFIICLSFG